MFSKKIEKALNRQLNSEFFSWYNYLALCSFFRMQNLHGFSQWMNSQANREMMHAMKIYDFLPERGGRVMLQEVSRPDNGWNSSLEAVEQAYRHEQEASGLINDLIDMAMAEKAHATGTFLQWFVNEQVEEEARLRAIVEKLKLIGDDRYGLFLIDRDLGLGK